MNHTAAEIAARLGIDIPQVPIGVRIGSKARPGQYIKKQDKRTVCMAEQINSLRGAYRPHQGRKECARRVRQLARQAA